MKKVLFMIFAAAMLTACESGYYGGEVNRDEPSQVETKKFTFTVKGDFKSPTFNQSKMRKAASALADDAQLTDLWVFDYQDGAIIQTLHQSAGDTDWGKPVLNLTYGHHDVCFVASRGTTPAVNGGVITWEKPSDTFWRDDWQSIYCRRAIQAQPQHRLFGTAVRNVWRNICYGE